MECNMTAYDLAGRHSLVHSKIVMEGLESAGYDALCQILELEFSSDGQVWQFYDVPEAIWYEWRNANDMKTYYHNCIMGKYISRFIGVRIK